MSELRIALAAMALILVAGCSAGTDDPPQPTLAPAASSAPPTQDAARISAAADECGLGDLVEQDGASIVTVSLAKDVSTADWEQVTCLLDGLGAPSFVTDRILHESSKGATLTETWDGLEVRWSFTNLTTGYRVTVIDRELT